MADAQDLGIGGAGAGAVVLLLVYLLRSRDAREDKRQEAELELRKADATARGAREERQLVAAEKTAEGMLEQARAMGSIAATLATQTAEMRDLGAAVRGVHDRLDDLTPPARSVPLAAGASGYRPPSRGGKEG